MVPALRRALLALALACTGGLVAAPAGAQPLEPDSLEVKEVRFVGAHTFPDALLRAAIETRASGCSSPVLFAVCWLGLARDRRYVDDGVLRQDSVRLTLFYWERGYREAVVDPDTVFEGGRAVVVFNIDEGLPVRLVSFEIVGADEVLPPNALRNLPLRPGEPFSLIDYDATRDTLIGRLMNRGYARAEVLRSADIRTDSIREATVLYEVYPGTLARFGEIEVRGAEKVSPSVIRRMLTIAPGDLYRRNELLRSQRNLFGLDILRHAQITAVLDHEPDSIVPVVVQVNEGDTHRVRVGAGISTAECANAEARWTSRNFFGGARRLELRGNVANVLAEELGAFPCWDTGDGTYSKIAGALSADFVQPWFYSPLNTFNAGLFLERRSLPEVFVRTALGGYVSISRRLDSRSTLTLAYRPELTKLNAAQDLFFCVSLVACADRDIQVLREPHWLAPVALTFARDESNALFAPTHGYILRLDVEHAARITGSDFAYSRFAAEWSGYWEIADDIVLAGRLRPAWARATSEPGAGLGLHPQRRFFSGGPASVRGYAQNRLGPKVVTVDASRFLALPDSLGGAGCSAARINDGTCDAGRLDQVRFPGAFEPRPTGGAAVFEGSAELRFPLVGTRLRGAAFLDFGQAWSRVEDFGSGGLIWTPGFGVRYFTPIGPIRVDLGYNPGRAESVRVITTEVCEQTESGCVPITGDGPLDPSRLRNTSTLRLLDRAILWDPNPRDEILRRFQLHLSIGQAF